jgi:hypothetical protein
MIVQTGGMAFAIGVKVRSAFRVRCVRFGLLAASHERRDGEEIRACTLLVAPDPSKPVSTKIG